MDAALSPLSSTKTSETNRQDPDDTNVWVTEAKCGYWPPVYICYILGLSSWKQLKS